MYPKYMDGDTLIIQLQPDCESGQDAVVYINGYDATLKKVSKQQKKPGFAGFRCFCNVTLASCMTMPVRCLRSLLLWDR